MQLKTYRFSALSTGVGIYFMQKDMHPIGMGKLEDAGMLRHREGS